MSHDEDVMLTPQQLREALTETDLPAVIEKTRARLDLPPKPRAPAGKPQDFMEALFTPGVCAIPLWCEDVGRYRWGCLCDGGPIRDSRTGRMAMCDSYDEAMAGLKEWAAHRSGKADATQEESSETKPR